MSIASPGPGDTKLVKDGAYVVEHVSGGPYNPAFDSVLGWNGFARAIPDLGDNDAVTFYAPVPINGGIVGISPSEPANVTGLTHALHVANGVLQARELGAAVGTAQSYADTDALSIRVVSGVVTYRKNGTTFHTSAVAAAGTVRTVFTYLYAAGDAVWNMVVDTLTAGARSGTAAIAIAPMYAVGADTPYATAAMQVEPFYVVSNDLGPIFNEGRIFGPSLDVQGGDAGAINAGVANLEPFIAYGSDVAAYAYAEIEMLPFTVEAEAGVKIVVVLPNQALVISGGFTTLHDLNASIVGPLTISDTPTARILIPTSIISALVATGDFTIESLLQGTIEAALDITDGYSPTMSLVAVFGSSAIATALITASQDLVASIVARLLIRGSGDEFLGTEQAIASRIWVVNETTGSSTRYEDFDFNSFAKIGDRYYGARPGGIYLLGGDTDAGEPIRASIDYGLLRIAAGALARIGKAYIGATSSGPLFMRLTARDPADKTGETLESYVYEARNSADHMKTQRFDLGRGLRDTFFEIEIYNGEGEDFELNSLEFVPMPTSRRV